MIPLLLSVALSAPQNPDAEELLAKVRGGYEAVKSAEFLVRYEATEAGRTIKGETRYAFVAPNKLAAEFLGVRGGPSKLVSDGQRISVVSEGKVTEKHVYSEKTLGQHIPTNVETIAFYDAKHELSTGRDGAMNGSTLTIKSEQKWNERTWTVLHEENRLAAVSIDYYIDPKSLLLWRTYGVDTRTHKPFIDSQIVELVLNKPIDTHRFDLP